MHKDHSSKFFHTRIRFFTMHNPPCSDSTKEQYLVAAMCKCFYYKLNCTSNWIPSFSMMTFTAYAILITHIHTYIYIYTMQHIHYIYKYISPLSVPVGIANYVLSFSSSRHICSQLKSKYRGSVWWQASLHQYLQICWMLRVKELR
jgi:hypothetical protein